jgi:hypothetical protein
MDSSIGQIVPGLVNVNRSYLYTFQEKEMELFRVETGAVPGQSCSEETMPMLKRSPRKNTSKVFLVTDSLASVANVPLIFADPSKQTKVLHVKPDE